MSTTPEAIRNYEKYVWEFDPYPDDSTAPLQLDGVDGNMPEYKRGKEVEITFLLWDSVLDRGDETASGLSGGTYGGAGGMTYGGAGGGTYGVNRAPRDYTDRYRELRSYGDYAGAAASGKSANHRPWYREQLPPVADVDTLVVRITPGPGIESAPAFWCLLTDISDDTELYENYARVTFTVKMLAEAEEYATHSDIDADLGDTL